MHKKSMVLTVAALFASALLVACGGGSAASSQTVLSGETTQSLPGTGTDNGSAAAPVPQPPAGGTTRTPGAPGTPGTTAPTKADVDAAWTAILTEVGTPTASAAAQCAVVAAGAKACGGPSAYLVYSREVSDEPRLLAQVAQHATLLREWNQANQVISDCSMVMPPQSLGLVDGICRAGAH